MSAPRSRVALRFALALGAAPAGAVEVGPPELVAPLAGPGASPVPPGALFGTDLGWTFEHGGEIRILFGDTSAREDSVCAGIPLNDDSEGTLPLAAPGGPPTLSVVTEPGSPGVFAPIHVPAGRPLAPDGLRAGADRRLERRRRRRRALRSDRAGCLPAAPGEEAELPQPTATGFCIDPTSSQLGGASSDRVFAVAHEQEIALERPGEPATWDSVARWRTNKFIDATAQTVARFSRGGAGSDWGPGAGALLVWGRPWWGVDSGRGAQVHLYLAVFDLPLRREGGRARLRPRYFAGVDAQGRLRWSRSESKAAPLAMDGATGGSPDDVQPILNQTAIAWLGEPIRKWVMLYSGGAPLGLIPEPGPAPGAIRIRFAEQPWGPWSPAQPHLAPGSFGVVGDPYGPGGVLFHPRCVDQGTDLCARSDLHRGVDWWLDPVGCSPIGANIDFGVFYGANVVDAWSEADGEGGFDLYWNVSTWNPYGVLLYRTKLRP